MLYFLAYNKDEKRQMIVGDQFPLDSCDEEGHTEANSWVEAKHMFGFPLTPTQESMKASNGCGLCALGQHRFKCSRS